MTPRLHALAQDELTDIGDPDALRTAVSAELDAFSGVVLGDHYDLYTDDQIHAVIDARLAALPETGPERTAIQRTYELLLVIIDGGVADRRSDHELLHWIEKFRPVPFI